MKTTFLLVPLIALLAGGCSSRNAPVVEAEKKVADTEKLLQMAKEQPNGQQLVRDLEKKVEAAKAELKAAAAPAAGGNAVAPVIPAAPKEFVVPAGTAIRVRTTNTLSTKTAPAGTPFEASLMDPLTVDGEVIAPAGAAVSGVVLNSNPGGRVKGKASISLGLKSIATKYGPMAVVTNSRGAVAKSTVKRDVIRGGIMTGAGAAIGAIAGGGKGAAIGAGVGGGAGTATALATRGDAAVIGAEAVLNFTLSAPATVREQR